MKKTMVISAFLGLMLFLVGCQTENKGEIEVIKMGLIPADDSDEMLRNYEPIKDYLSKQLGIPVEIQVTSDYTAAIEAMRAKHIDMAWFGPFSYVIAANVAGAEAIVNGVKESTGSATYKSLIIANKDSGIKTLEDLKGKTFAFVDPASTSGNLIPRKMLIENEIDPDNDFSTSYYAGTHNAVQYAISNGKVDAGASGDNVYYRMIEAGEIDSEVNVIIHESEPIPGSPIVVRDDLPEALKKGIQNALISMDQQTIHKVDGWGGIASYQAVSDSDYDVIRETAILLGMDVTSAEAANK
ncbi:phosphonate ABC transporter substrate-binding protein [Candidatus Woesearchaeota archaeon B3_Woes]|nr:MAG: phosphonate ABC transporter substrate-binding protein [Candidatus Woesearchaeota archaeon B3_Woes]